MMFGSILKTSSGEFEINRVVGAFGSLVYVVGTHVFMAYDIFIKDRPFDVTAYCLSFPGGLAVAVGAIAGSVAIKDRSVAAAQKTMKEAGPPEEKVSP